MTKSNDSFEIVAVKMLKESDAAMTSAAAEQEMRRELEIMKKLRHDNVVRILAVLNDDMKVIIIMEFFDKGCLKSYLNSYRDEIKMPTQLFIYAQNIVEGMEYLGREGIIHRDLAARNILVASDELVKISDFGLARSVEKDPYVMSSATNIPIKWLALECLTNGTYTYASDVWSFGVTLWEMFSLGADPYLSGCENFFTSSDEAQQQEEMRQWLTSLGEGVRMPRPELCPASLYTEVMMPCWNTDPKARPSFGSLLPILARVERQVT